MALMAWWTPCEALLPAVLCAALRCHALCRHMLHHAVDSGLLPTVFLALTLNPALWGRSPMRRSLHSSAPAFSRYSLWLEIFSLALPLPHSDLSGRGLPGQLPLDAVLWVTLSTLRTLDLSSNRLSGFLPDLAPEMGATLGALSLANNSLAGGSGRLRRAMVYEGGDDGVWVDVEYGRGVGQWVGGWSWV